MHFPWAGGSDMRFGAMNFPVVPVLDEIETFARLGFDYLELAMDPPMAHHRNAFILPDGHHPGVEGQRPGACLSPANLSIHC
jgi:hypothetical protein